ncbi:MAG: hypothetical protein GWN00_35605 [Aliifodinibius sp.]|nr:hypothetical protein [candidate division Zixibacteria bacterium]NIR67415.1 hypothetical protein [candidate division Zixibacteria bacterium]NIT61345.1 hypothetical protein [Fodinibius sp.]NIY29925.1 hypothetical protein [Fodinibius sp.]
MSQPEIVKKEYNKHKKKVSKIDIFDGKRMSELQKSEQEKRFEALRGLCKNVRPDKGGSCIEQVRAGRSNYKCDICLKFERRSY